jgi:hypothetical protein
MIKKSKKSAPARDTAVRLIQAHLLVTVAGGDGTGDGLPPEPTEPPSQDGMHWS